jgi:hypothetical protein
LATPTWLSFIIYIRQKPQIVKKAGYIADKRRSLQDEDRAFYQ